MQLVALSQVISPADLSVYPATAISWVIWLLPFVIEMQAQHVHAGDVTLTWPRHTHKLHFKRAQVGQRGNRERKVWECNPGASL